MKNNEMTKKQKADRKKKAITIARIIQNRKLATHNNNIVKLDPYGKHLNTKQVTNLCTEEEFYNLIP